MRSFLWKNAVFFGVGVEADGDDIPQNVPMVVGKGRGGGEEGNGYDWDVTRFTPISRADPNLGSLLDFSDGLLNSNFRNYHEVSHEPGKIGMCQGTLSRNRNHA